MKYSPTLYRLKTGSFCDAGHPAQLSHKIPQISLLPDVAVPVMRRILKADQIGSCVTSPDHASFIDIIAIILNNVDKNKLVDLQNRVK
jgi:hypothetical protein